MQRFSWASRLLGASKFVNNFFFEHSEALYFKPAQIKKHSGTYLHIYFGVKITSPCNLLVTHTHVSFHSLILYKVIQNCPFVNVL